jgi:hypothetical protein
MSFYMYYFSMFQHLFSLFQAFCDSSSDRSWSDALFGAGERLGGGYPEPGTPGTPYSDPRTPSGTPFSDQLDRLGGLVVGGGGGNSRSNDPVVFGMADMTAGGVGSGDGGGGIASGSSPHPHSPAAGFAAMSRTNAAFPALHHPVNSAAEFYYEDRVDVGTAAEGPARFWPTAGLAAGDPAAAYLDMTSGGGWPVAAGPALDHRPMASHDVERYLNGGGSNGGDVSSGGGVYSPCLGTADRPLSRASLRSSSSADSTVDDNNGGGGGLGHQQHLHHHQHHHQGFLTGGGGRQFPVIAVMAADSQVEEGGHTGFTPEHCYTGFID